MKKLFMSFFFFLLVVVGVVGVVDFEVRARLQRASGQR